MRHGPRCVLTDGGLYLGLADGGGGDLARDQRAIVHGRPQQQHAQAVEVERDLRADLPLYKYTMVRLLLIAPFPTFCSPPTFRKCINKQPRLPILPDLSTPAH